MSSTSPYCVYLLECCDGSYYCGITTDMEQRLKQHNAGTASRYTRGRTPITVLAKTPNCYSKSMALQLEHQIKKRPKHKKAEMMASITKKRVEDIKP
jgi:putative endonuclease